MGTSCIFFVVTAGAPRLVPPYISRNIVRNSSIAFSSSFSSVWITKSGRAPFRQKAVAATSSWRARPIDVEQTSLGAIPHRPFSLIHFQWRTSSWRSGIQPPFSVRNW